MQTFVAQFIRPNGESGVLHLVADSSLDAMLEVFITEGQVRSLTLQPQRRAALLQAPAGTSQPMPCKP